MTRFITNSSGSEVVAALAELENAIVMPGVTAYSTESDGITAFGGPHQIGVFGALGAAFNAISVINGFAVKLHVGATGQLIGTLDGASIAGGGTRIENHGTITSLGGRGVALLAPPADTSGPAPSPPAPALLRNYGTISGDTGIEVTGLSARVVNFGLITAIDARISTDIPPGANAIVFDSGAATIRNQGTILGNIVLGSGLDVVLNRGTIFGDLITGEGADLVDTRAGLIDGTIDLGGGADRFLGSAGDDTVIGGASADVLDGRGGDDTLKGDVGKDTLLGGDGRDTLIGGAGADVLNGGNGDDIIDGGGINGTDELTGGKGADVFVFDKSSLNISEIDRILDFSRAEGDRIDLSLIDAVKSTTFDNPFSFIGTQAFSGVAGQLRFENSGGMTTLLGDTDGNSVADFALFIAPKLVLTAGDFIL